MAATFDEAELLERVDNDLGFLAETVEMIVADGPGLLAQARAAAAAGDAPGLARHAHALKGMISNFCAAGAQACALELEKLGKSGEIGGAPAMLERMDRELGALIGELQGFVRARS